MVSTTIRTFLENRVHQTEREYSQFIDCCRQGDRTARLSHGNRP